MNMKFTEENNKIVQIIPAEGWWALYKEADGKYWKSKVACFALFQDGSITPMDCDSSGWVDICKETDNLYRIYHQDEEPNHELITSSTLQEKLK